MIQKIRSTYDEYPKLFWTITGASFIDQVGGALIFPFIALYITGHFNVGMTEVGKIFAIVALTGIFGSGMGGAMADRFGRKSMVLFGLIVSAVVTLLLAFATNINQIYILVVFIGLFGNAGGPARQAMLADILPEDKRADGFGILRVVANLAVTIGPAIGGFLAQRSYLFLFITDVILSTITALIFYFTVPETKPQAKPVKEQIPGREPQAAQTESFLKTLGGYTKVLQDGLFMAFWVGSLFMVLAYMQMNSTLSVYLRDIHGIPEQLFGYILSTNAGMVVLFQFAITRRIKRFPPMLVMVAGTFLYAIGFTMYGFVATYALFLLAMIIITIGEMLVAPVGQALATKLAPEDMRGRYMAVYGFHWAIPTMFGPLVAGLIMDNYNPDWVWYACGIVLIISMTCYFLIHISARDKLEMKVNGQNGNLAKPTTTAAEPTTALAD
jgi:MFS family permease